MTITWLIGDSGIGYVCTLHVVFVLPSTFSIDTLISIVNPSHQNSSSTVRAHN